MHIKIFFIKRHHPGLYSRVYIYNNMKKYLFPVLMIIGGCSSRDTMQKQKTMNNTPASKPMVCKLTTPEQQKRRATVIAQLKQQVLEKKELPNGYAFKFNGTDGMLDQLTDFIKSERMCCDFFDFMIQVSNEGTAW